MGEKWGNSWSKRLSLIYCQDWWIRSLKWRNHKFLLKLNPPSCNYRSSIPYLRKANIQLQEFIFFGNDKKRNSNENLDVVRSQKGICLKAKDNLSKIGNAKPATFLTPDNSNCMMKANLLQSREMVNCLVLILLQNLGYLKEIFLTMECRRKMTCVVLVV